VCVLTNGMAAAGRHSLLPGMETCRCSLPLMRPHAPRKPTTHFPHVCLPWLCLLLQRPIDLMKYARRGQLRSRLWLTKVVGQLLADKVVADAVADRQQQPRSTMAEFIFTWHMNRCVVCVEGGGSQLAEPACFVRYCMPGPAQLVDLHRNLPAG
jgi:hypothetical protein